MRIPFYAHITLTRNEKFVLLRWIMGNPSTLIAKEMGVSRQRVYQLFEAGIAKLLATDRDNPGNGTV
jgi:DNA-binding CsgD family transcriptional regulator